MFWSEQLYFLVKGDAIQCQSLTNGTKIIGGEEVSIRLFPWQVAISASTTHMCGGSILSPTKILSAAHCYASYTQAQLLKFLRVRAGSSRHNEQGTVREVIRVVLHPDFNAPTRMNNDISVLILKSKLDYGPKIQANCCLAPMKSSQNQFYCCRNRMCWERLEA